MGLGGPYTASTSGTPDTIEVLERTPGVTSNALLHDDNIVLFDHISAADGHDSWTFPVKPEPRTMYIVKLFTPIDTDLDLIGYAPAISANGFSANGFSANGFSANGFSANGFSANGFSANGFSANGFSANGFSANGFSSTASSDQLDDIAVSELAPAGSTGYTLSANRGDTSETLYMFSNFGDAGNLTFTVTDYDGARSDAPYVLTVQSVKPTANPALGPCRPAPWDLTQAPGAAPAAWTGTETPRTLFVTNRQVAASEYGPAAADAGIAALQTLAARPEVRGIVFTADHLASVRTAYTNWRNDWCNPTAANIAASQVRSGILDLRAQYPSIDTVVIAGGGDVVPEFRLSDGSPLANEVQYADALIKATGGNDPLVAAYVNGTILSSDPYGNTSPLPFGTSFAFPPDIGISRLIESPEDWIAEKDQYIAANGNLDPQDGFISGETGMVDGANAAADVLAGRGIPMTRLTDESGPWTANDFRTKAFTNSPDISGYNADTNHFSILSAAGSKNNDISEVVRSSESSGIPFGTLVFSNGCHFGTSVPDKLNGAPTDSQRTRLLDWDQAITSQRRGIAVANSGFGIFDTETIGQGERLQVEFLKQTATSPNVAVALSWAKNSFFASPGAYDAYSYKTLQQLSMYGLGIFKMFGSTPAPTPVPPPASTTSIDLSVGPYTVDTAGTSTCDKCYRLKSTSNGTKVELHDSSLTTGSTSTSGYWSAPLSVQEKVLPPGKLSAGIWYNELESVKQPDMNTVITRLAVNRSDREIESQTAAPFPTSSGMVNDVAGKAVATLLHGISIPTRMQDGKVISDVHLYTKIRAELLLRPDTTVGRPAHIDEVTVVQSEDGTLAVIDVTASEQYAPNVRAAALSRDDAGVNRYTELTKGPNGHWSGAVLLGGSATEIQDLHIQVSNGLDVAHWRFKGDKPLVQGKTVNGVDLALSGSRHTSGVYLGTVTATVVGTAGVRYRVYDNDYFVGTFSSGGTFTVPGDGAHEIQVLGSDGSGYRNTIAIDGSTPTIDVVTPRAGASYPKGTLIAVDVRVADTGTGATYTIKNDGQTIANGAPLNTSTVGQHTIVVDAHDQVGHVATTVTRTYNVTSGYVISDFFSPIAPKPTLNVVKTGSSIAVKFTITDASGNEITDPAVISQRVWRPISCKTFAVTGAEFATVGTTPEYSGFFHFNTTAPANVGCYELVVRLDDGSTKTAYFQVKK